MRKQARIYVPYSLLYTAILPLLNTGLTGTESLCLIQYDADWGNLVPQWFSVPQAYYESWKLYRNRPAHVQGEATMNACLDVPS